MGRRSGTRAGVLLLLCACGPGVQPRSTAAPTISTAVPASPDPSVEGGAPDGIPPVAREPTPPLRLCAWNVRRLGHGTNKDYELVARILEAHCDLAAITEVMQRGGAHPGWDRLLEVLGEGWTGLVTDAPRPATSAGHAEFYGVAWRPDRAAACEGGGGLRYHADHDGGPTGQGEDRFSREPAYGCFVAGTFDFVLAVYHARFARGNVGEISDEVANLGDVLASMAALREGERDLIVAGDFNLRPDDLARVVPFYDATVGTGSTLRSDGTRTENLYDHLVVENKDATAELVSEAVVVDVRDQATSPEAFHRTVSDHLPIVAAFRVDGVDDD